VVTVVAIKIFMDKKNKKGHKYIFVIGGVMSGVGKGVTTSSLGMLLQAKGFKVNMVKVDPYLNVDAGTMNPTEHGEVFVLNSGLETDQDMGNYERFLGRDISERGYMTSGMVYKTVIDRERSLGYGGKTVEAIPDIRDEIIARFEDAADKADSDISIVEIGGTVGDYQNIMFIEAARVLKIRKPRDVIFIMVSYLPVPGKLGEMKSKPTQNAMRQLNSYGVHADVLVARSEVPMDEKRREKIAISCSIPSEYVISAPDVSNIYEVPMNFEKGNLSSLVCDLLSLNCNKTDVTKWKAFTTSIQKATKTVSIAVVGKYFDTGDFTLSDAYLSVIEALKFSAFSQGAKPVLSWVNAKDFEKDPKKLQELKKYDGIVVPGGFGEKGIEGKLSAIKFARENKIPYFGLCYGMQLMVIEYARNVLGWSDANTAEITTASKHLVIDIMPEQKKKLLAKDFGGSMRLGSYTAVLKDKTVARKAYGAKEVVERHRHRYEVNPLYKEEIEKAGLTFSGTSPDGTLAEIAELPEGKHPFFLGVQFHPEFLARPLSPHPLFTAFIKAALKK
jgi:CTP synthase